MAEENEFSEENKNCAEKLSEKINDNNKYKNKLIEMEQPITEAPAYSVLVIGLMIYVWIFLFTMAYYDAPHLNLSIFVVCFSTIGVLLSYRKNNTEQKKCILSLPFLLFWFQHILD